MYGNRVRDNSKKASKVKFWLRYLDSLRHDGKKFLICFSYNFEFTKGFCVLYPSKSYYKVASMICTIKCPWGLDQVKDGEGLWEVPISSPNGGKIFYLLKKKKKDLYYQIWLPPNFYFFKGSIWLSERKLLKISLSKDSTFKSFA